MPQDRVLPAIALRLASVVAFAVMSALIKLAEMRGAKLGELLFFRQALSLPLVLTWVALGPGLHTLKTERLPAHILRCTVGLTSMTFMFLALMILPLAEATTLMFTVPIFATILGALVLKEPTGWHRWSAVVLGFIGVVIVAQPGSGHIPLYGAVIGLLAAFLNATVSILVRTIGKTEPPATIVFYFATLSMVPLFPIFWMTTVPHPMEVWLLLIGTGIAGGVGQLTMTGSLRLAPVSIVVPMDYTSLLWATLAGWLLFSTLPDPWTWVGAPVIIASGLYIVWREQRLKRGVASEAQPFNTD